MKSKLSLKNSVTQKRSGKIFLRLRNAAPLVILSITIVLSGCTLHPFFSRKEIPGEIQRICKQSFGLDVNVKEAEKTLWVYAPFTDMLVDKTTINPDTITKLNNVVISISRALLDSKNPPQFYVFVASDITVGADYFLIGYVDDIIKHQTSHISRDDFLERHVAGFNLNPKAVGDTTGSHLVIGDVSLPDFLSRQIGQRIQVYCGAAVGSLTSAEQPVRSVFENGRFVISIDTQKVNPTLEQADIVPNALKIASSVLHNYDFADFSGVDIHDTVSDTEVSYGKEALKEFK